MSITAVFYDHMLAYIEMPYFEGGNMRGWLESLPKDYEVHVQGCNVHRDSNPNPKVNWRYKVY